MACLYDIVVWFAAWYISYKAGVSMTPSRQPHLQRCEHETVCKMRREFVCTHKDPLFHCSEDTRENNKLPEDTEVELSCGSIEATHTSSPAPAKTPQECENRNCLECPLWEPCHVMDEMPMCARATYDGVRKNAAKAEREQFVEQIEDKLPRYPSDLGDMYLLSDIQDLLAQQEQL